MRDYHFCYALSNSSVFLMNKIFISKELFRSRSLKELLKVGGGGRC